MQVTLLTGRTIEQGVGKEQGKLSDEYFRSAAICYIDPIDLRKLGIKEGSNILVSTKYGSVVVKAARSLRSPHKGIAFIPYGPWANAVVNNETDSIGMPLLKGIPARIDCAPTEPILSLKELLKLEFRK